MNFLTGNPDAALHIAHQTVDDRVDRAQVRARVRALRSERRAARRRDHARRTATPAVPASATARFARLAR